MKSCLIHFAGSASTYQACVETGRICITTELDDHYFNVAKDRISKIKNITTNFF
jgi:DNA modification methylase